MDARCGRDKRVTRGRETRDRPTKLETDAGDNGTGTMREQGVQERHTQ